MNVMCSTYKLCHIFASRDAPAHSHNQQLQRCTLKPHERFVSGYILHERAIFFAIYVYVCHVLTSREQNSFTHGVWVCMGAIVDCDCARVWVLVYVRDNAREKGVDEGVRENTCKRVCICSDT